MIKQGKIADDSVEEDEERGSDEAEEGSDSKSELVKDEGIEKERSHINTVIFVAVGGVNVAKDEWVAVLMTETGIQGNL